MLQRVYVWEWPVRFTHWVNAVSIVILCFTGIYIGTPFIYAPPGEPFVMSIMRFIHFVAAYFFAASFWLRIYWFFVGNQYARWGDFIPLTKQQWKYIFDDIRYYTFVKKEIHHRAGHHSLAAFTYLGLFLLFHLEIVTGFALQSVSHHGWVYKLMGGWFLPFISAQTLRLIHHLVMWLVIVFAMTHIYIGWFIDIVEKNAGMSSIFGGYKILDESEILSDRPR
jgi:Ni/Fe-hydrogenase 1 B-type cytochrome subunit